MYNTIALPLSYINLTSTCAACSFTTFWVTKCYTCSDLSLRYSFLISRLRLLVTLSRFLSLYHKAFDCESHTLRFGLKSHSSLFHMGADRSSAVPLVDTLQCYPQIPFINPALDIVPPFGRNLQTLPVASLTTLLWRGPVRESPFGRIATVYLMGRCPQIHFTKNKNTKLTELTMTRSEL